MRKLGREVRVESARVGRRDGADVVVAADVLDVDDLGDRDLICDVLLDQNLGARAEKYNGKLLFF